MKKPKLRTTALAKLEREICNNLYNEGGASKVYNHANKIGLQYNPCEPCEADTPTITDINGHTCAVCGQGKEIDNEYSKALAKKLEKVYDQEAELHSKLKKIADKRTDLLHEFKFASGIHYGKYLAKKDLAISSK